MKVCDVLLEKRLFRGKVSEVLLRNWLFRGMKTEYEDRLHFREKVNEAMSEAWTRPRESEAGGSEAGGSEARGSSIETD